MKKTLSALFSLFAVSVLADSVYSVYEESTGYTWYYTVSDGRATIKRVSPKEGKDLVVPGSVDGYKVVGIDTRSSVFGPNNIRESSLVGFYGTLTLPEGIEFIGEEAFTFCSNITGILNIPKSVTTISKRAFYGCSGFTGSLTIPDSVTTIGDSAFNGCSGFTGSLTIGSSVTTIGGSAFFRCSGFTGSLTIPDSVTTIGGSAFSGCSGFTGSLTIPDSVTAIGDSAFNGCSGFTGSLTIGSSVTTIGGSAFKGCSGFTGSLTIPDSVTTIGGYAFDGCSGFTGSLTIPDSVTAIGDCTFRYCRGFTGSLTILDGVTTIGASAFWGCSGFTGSLTIPDSVTTIGESAFRDCNGFTGSLTIPDSITAIGYSAFDGCSGFTGSLTIPDSVMKISDRAFYGCSGFTGSLTIGGSVTTIGKDAFYGCSGFTGSLTIPNSVTTIGSNAFYRCSGLSDLVFVKGALPQGFRASSLWGKKISYLPEYGTAWKKFLIDNDGLIYDAGYIRSNAQSVSIVFSKIRDTDPTVMDVVYKVTSSQPTVKVRTLAFKDGVRSFANVVRPETFIEGTDANIGDGIAANVEHKLSWKVSADWQETLAKVKFEVLAIEDALLPLELTTLPNTDSQPKMEVSWNVMFDSWVFDALMWLYADKDLGLTLTSGVLKNGDVRLADGASVGKTMYDATVYVYGKMGYELLQGERLEYARQMLRRNLPGVSQAQYAVKVIEE